MSAKYQPKVGLRWVGQLFFGPVNFFGPNFWPFFAYSKKIIFCLFYPSKNFTQFRAIFSFRLLFSIFLRWKKTKWASVRAPLELSFFVYEFVFFSKPCLLKIAFGTFFPLVFFFLLIKNFPILQMCKKGCKSCSPCRKKNKLYGRYRAPRRRAVTRMGKSNYFLFSLLLFFFLIFILFFSRKAPVSSRRRRRWRMRVSIWMMRRRAVARRGTRIPIRTRPPTAPS